MLRKSARGFTLIELLIVVAIIAILAMIAVPNFIEAQTRSKVSRAKADMRSLATALEAYMVEWNSYTSRNNEAENPESIGSDDPEGRWGGFLQLTTPVAFITSIPRDPFGVSRYRTTPGGWRPAYLSLGTGDAGSRYPSGARWNPDRRGFPSNCYELESDGPDHWDDTRDYGSIDLSTGQFPWRTLNPNVIIPEVHRLLYDPTNGTVSAGEIMRFGGSVPGGAVYHYLWASTSK